MSVAALVQANAVVMDDRAEILGRIVEPEVHLAVWQRMLPGVLAPLQLLDWDMIDDIDETVPVDALGAQLPVLLEAAGYDKIAPALAREILWLGTAFGAIMHCDALRLRLEVIETDACRRFHADNVTARLLMPIVGPGTQWVYAGAEHGIAQLFAGEVGVFKGRRWAEEARILHRSPPIATTGETRLLLALEPPEEDAG